MKRRIENLRKNIFYKTNPREGISLIVLVITIIVVIILAAAIVVSIVNNNLVIDANRARYESDRDNMQYIFTNTVGKIMAEKHDTIIIDAKQLNEVTIGNKKAIGETTYKLSGGSVGGKIIFDSLSNKDNDYYTGKQLPIYNKETIWNVDKDGILILHVGKEIYGEEGKEKDNLIEVDKDEYENMKEELEKLKKEAGKVKMIYLGKFNSYVENIIDVSKYEGYQNFTIKNFIVGNARMGAIDNVVEDDLFNYILNPSSYDPSTGILKTNRSADSDALIDWMMYMEFDMYLVLGDVEYK